MPLREEAVRAAQFQKIFFRKKIFFQSDIFRLVSALDDKLESKEEQLKNQIADELEKMAEDGFLDEQKKKEFEYMLKEQDLKDLDRLKAEIERSRALYNAYDAIREEVLPLVDEWFDYFVERLPRQQEVESDEDSLTRQGVFNRRAVQKSRNLIFGTVKNPRMIRDSVKPLFMASIMVDVSGSMKGSKLESARKLLIFYSELFSKIERAFGFVRFSINVFSDSLSEIKAYDQDYDSSARYGFPDGTTSTVKVRLMEGVCSQGGTNMLDPIKKASTDLSREAREYPDYASAFYFIGDGGDTCGNAPRAQQFLETNQELHGFGDHMRSAIMLGSERERQELAAIFGDEHTTVAPDFAALIEQSMRVFDSDIEFYLRDKTH